MSGNNIYLEQIYQVLPGLFGRFDRDPVSPTHGVGDRLFWGWKLIDFGNGTFQGMANGLARLVTCDLLPEDIKKKGIEQRIDEIFKGTKFLTRPNGSLEEAFPFESSYCVTALVAYDLLTAIELLNPVSNTEKISEYLQIISPLIQHLIHNDEKHAFISNHLATAAAALIKWSIITGEDTGNSGENLLDRILSEQSPEGWYKEYDGADPGYQSLCMYYLADIARIRQDLNLMESLKRALDFLIYFVHPDGSFGGLYGSRNTRFYYPAGFEYLAKTFEKSYTFAQFMRDSIQNNTVVNLLAMDPQNMVPMFNSYSWAAQLLSENGPQDSLSSREVLPMYQKQDFTENFPKAGIIIDKGKQHYTVISTHKGGVVQHYVDGKQENINSGVVIKNKQKGKYYSTQSFNPENAVQFLENEIRVESQFVLMHHQLPSPAKFIILRLLNVTVMRSTFLSTMIKKLLVKLLITGNNSIPVVNVRKIQMGPDLTIADLQNGNFNQYEVVQYHQPFRAIHMASQGYWQRQDDEI